MFFRYNFLSLAWAILILVLSFLPGRNLPNVQIVALDKLVHFIFYLLLFVFTMYGWRRQLQITLLRKVPIALVWLACILFGIAIEVCQEVFTADRHFDWLDIMANSMGALAGGMAWYYLLQEKFLPGGK
ncbi:MAG: VanZ family protein [Chitinophagales bacterium]|nr:VanZ family protein [Chitinophagales bacterium]